MILEFLKIKLFTKRFYFRNIVILFFILSSKFLFSQQIINKNPFNIKKTNVSAFLFMSPMGVGTAGPQLRISHYLRPRMMLIFNAYAGLVDEGGFEMGPSSKIQRLIDASLSSDIHLIDYSKNKNVVVQIPYDREDTTTENIDNFIKVESSVRRILAFTGGIQLYKNRQKVTSKKQEKDETDNIPIKVLKSGNDTIINSRISTNAAFTNLLIGFKFKSINATEVKFKQGNSIKDIHLETYFSLIIPIAYNYQKELYNGFFDQAPTHRLLDYKPKTGFKMGVYNRNSKKNNWTFGAEFGVQPTIAPRYLNGTFIHLSLGYSLNFGKVK